MSHEKYRTNDEPTPEPSRSNTPAIEVEIPDDAIEEQTFSWVDFVRDSQPDSPQPSPRGK